MTTPTPRPAGLDALLDHVAANLPEPLPAVGEKWFCNTSTGVRTVTVTHAWSDDHGAHVAFEWRDDRPGLCGSTLPLAVFLGTYRPAGPPAESRLATLVAALRAEHYETDGSPDREGSCIADGQDWPCATIRAAEQATGGEQQ